MAKRRGASSSSSRRRKRRVVSINSSSESDEEMGKENIFKQAKAEHQNSQFVDLHSQLTELHRVKFKSFYIAEKVACERAINDIMRFAILRQCVNKPMDFGEIKEKVLSTQKSLLPHARALFAEAQVRFKAAFGMNFVEGRPDIVQPNLSVASLRKQAIAKRNKGAKKKGKASKNKRKGASSSSSKGEGKRSDIWFITNCLRSSWQCKRLNGRHLNPGPNDLEETLQQAERGLLILILAILWIEGGSMEQNALWRNLEVFDDTGIFKRVTTQKTSTGARANVKHPLFGDVRALVEKTFVQRKFLQRKRDGTDNDGQAVHRIIVGQRAAAEVGVHEVFEFIKQATTWDNLNGQISAQEIAFEDFAEWLRAQNGEDGQ
eukprot:g115.t1